MKLFRIDNNRCFPSEHALLIEPFKTIWETDPTETKENAIKVFSYIELVCSPALSNPFAGYNDIDRPSKVKKEVFGDENKENTHFMLEGCKRYMELLEEFSPTFPLYKSALKAAEGLKTFFGTESLLDKVTTSGSAKYKPADITKAMKEVPIVIETLAKMRKKVQEEITESDARTRKNRTINRWEE